MKKRINIYVLMGGPSPEYEVSLNTGRMIIKNLDRNKFNVFPIILSRKTKSPLKSILPKIKYRKNSVAFIAMHGPFGEDGTVQSILSLIGIPYTGSDIFSSALAMNKVISSEILKKNGILVPKFVAFNESEWDKNKEKIISEIKSIGFPIVIKPADLGSSVGIKIVHKILELNKAVNFAFSYSPNIMAQEYIYGREITCGVIDKGILGTEFPLQVTEIIPKKSKFFDYRAKYIPGASEEITPPNLPKPIIKKIQQTALACHRALGCSGMSRTDMILAARSGANSKFEIRNLKLYVLEVNTIPGMTETSLLPQGAKACGISFPQLLEHIISAALNRSKNKSNIKHQNAKLQIKIQK